MATFVEPDWVESRKIKTQSMTRHFAPWKLRYFVLDDANYLLGIRSPATKSMSMIPLLAPSIKILRHNYCVDEKFWLSIKYTDDHESGGPVEKEVIMKFNELNDLLRWQRVR